MLAIILVEPQEVYGLQKMGVRPTWRPPRSLGATKKMRARWTNPARSAQELTNSFELRGLRLTADFLHEAVALI